MNNKNLKNKIELKRSEDLVKISKKLIFFLVMPIVIQSIYTDIKLYGLNYTWVLLRLGIIPVGLLCIFLFKFRLFNKFASAPILISTFYIAAIHSYFVSQTGHAESLYFHSYIQILMGLSLLPLSFLSFVFGSAISILFFTLTIYIGANYDLSSLTHRNLIFLKTYILITFTIFYFMHKIRNMLIKNNLDLEEELIKREHSIKVKAEKLSDAKVESKKLNFLHQISSQVAHDIRSPLTSLNSFLSEIDSLEENQRILLRSSIRRIEDISNNLLTKSRNPEEEVEIVCANLISDSIRLISSEKRHSIKKLPNILIEENIDPNVQMLFSRIDKVEFKRILSNLLNNSIESVDGNGNIKINLKLKNKLIVVEM
jgi:signal transduction histidine kinase